MDEGIEQRQNQHDGIADHVKPGRRERTNAAVAEEIDEAGDGREGAAPTRVSLATMAFPNLRFAARRVQVAIPMIVAGPCSG